MAKVDLGLISNVIYAGGELTGSTLDLGVLPTGTKAYTVVYPRYGHIGEVIDISIALAVNGNNHLIASSENYRGTVVAACYMTI